MEYLKVKWIHEFEDEPVYIYSELNEQRDELRKVEQLNSGKMDYADDQVFTGNAFLSEVPIPENEEIASDPQFVVEIIAKEEFEEIWDRAIHQND